MHTYTGAEKYPILKAELVAKNLTSQKFVCLTANWRQIEANVPQLVAIATNWTQIGIKLFPIMGRRFLHKGYDDVFSDITNIPPNCYLRIGSAKSVNPNW
jgi:hypothetical protein